MRALRADFSRPSAWPVVALWVLAATVVALAAWVGAEDWRGGRRLQMAQARTQSISLRLEALRGEQAARAASAAEPAPFSTDAKRLATLSTFDAAGVFRSVEAVQVQGAKLSRLEIDAETRHVEIELDITSADVATAYVQALNAGTDRPAWMLTRIQSQGTSLSASIRSEAP